MTKQKKANIKPEKIQLLAIKVFKVHFEASEEFRSKYQEVKSYTTEAAMDSAFNFEEKQCRIKLHIKLTAVDELENPKGLEAEYGIEFHYKIENLESFLIHEKQNRVQIEGTLGNTLASMSYSTARGIILERLQGTYFNGVILPVINPGQLTESESENVK